MSVSAENEGVVRAAYQIDPQVPKRPFLLPCYYGAHKHGARIIVSTSSPSSPVSTFLVLYKQKDEKEQLFTQQLLQSEDVEIDACEEMSKVRQC